MKRTALHSIHRSGKSNLQTGFTLVELMIATLIFSVILLVIAEGVTYFGNAYYKGVNASNTQNVARGILDTVSQAIQFSGSAPQAVGTPASTYCIGNTQFDVKQGQEISSGGNNDALWQTPNTNSGGCSAVSPPVAASQELLGTRMRLSNLVIKPAGVAANRLWEVDLTIAYGDDDLLNGPMTTTPSCKSGAGSQWCSVSTLSVVVQQRLE